MRINGFPTIEQCPKCSKPLIELAGTCCKCNPYEERWEILKKQIESTIELAKKAGCYDYDYRFYNAIEAIQTMMEELEEK